MSLFRINCPSVFSSFLFLLLISIPFFFFLFIAFFLQVSALWPNWLFPLNLDCSPLYQFSPSLAVPSSTSRALSPQVKLYLNWLGSAVQVCTLTVAMKMLIRPFTLSLCFCWLIFEHPGDWTITSSVGCDWPRALFLITVIGYYRSDWHLKTWKV